MSSDLTIIDEWPEARPPPAPELKQVTVDPKVTAFLVLDIQYQNCDPEKRPPCQASVPKIKNLLTKAREKGMVVAHSLTTKGEVEDIREEVAPLPDEPVVKSSADKFFNTDLEKILRAKGITCVIVAGTSAHGAVLHTVTGAAQRGFQVIVPVDGMSADLYAEQYTAWHLVNGPGSRRQTTLTKFSMIQF